MMQTLSWENLSETFPIEVSLRGEILEFIRDNPGCGFDSIDGHLRPSSRAGLMAVILRMREDGDIVSNGPHPIERYHTGVNNRCHGQ